MPFTWKKNTRRNRFSQLVADHLQSPKRGGSLVVETGFPTSIIDLYVRNRGRFRKSSVKKQSEFESNDSLSQVSPNPFVGSGNWTSGGTDHAQIDEIVEEIDEIVGVHSVTSDDNIRNCIEVTEIEVEMVKLNPVLVGVLKGLLIMGLVLLTKGFTVGITVLAFVLILLESVAKRWSFNETGDVRSLETDTSFEVLEIEEEYVESKADEVTSEGLMELEIKRKGSRRAVMKSRMKKLVLKKLRKSSTGSKEEIVRASECSVSKGQSLRIVKLDQGDIVEVEAKSSGIECDGEGLGRGMHRSSGCLVLCLVVLVGLIGGRVLALVLALSWCLMLKKLQWRNVKFPVS
ncbi:uncharacterized protein LOC143612473 [Bidens hawaiensis]|uniref:uncharacterized protein LOC143612473 n=1 Tax=Bidens hawaiensis TaxID=980011 RepID=UPI00404A3D6D